MWRNYPMLASQLFSGWLDFQMCAVSFSQGGLIRWWIKNQSWCYNCKNCKICLPYLTQSSLYESIIRTKLINSAKLFVFTTDFMVWATKNRFSWGGWVTTLSTRELIGKLKMGQSMGILPFLTNVISLNIFGFWTLGSAKQANGLICMPCCTTKIISNSVLESWWQDPSEMWWEGRFTSLICCGQCDAVMSMWTKIFKECFQNPVDMQWRIKAVLKAKRDQTQYKQGATNKVAGERMCMLQHVEFSTVYDVIERCL